MRKILEGLARFQQDVYPQHRTLFRKLASSQSPEVLVVTCSDSRLVPSMMMQTDPGEIFVCRNAGNMIPAYDDSHGGGVTATIEYAVAVLGIRDIIVCGHSDCGAMKAMMHPEKLVNVPSVARWLHQGDSAMAVVRANYPGLSPEQTLERVTEENVLAQIDHLKTHPCVAARLRAGTVNIHGWVYQIETGQVRVYSEERKAFVALQAVSAVA